jgi:predicted extracellular nuclease
MGDRWLVLAALCAMTMFEVGCVGDSPNVDSSDADVSSPSASSSAKEPAATTDVHVLRNPQAPSHPAAGSHVRVEGLVVTGLKTVGNSHGFFLQHPTEPVWGGVYVYVGAAATDVAKGDVVSVEGVFRPYKGFDEIDVSAGAVERTSKAPMPDALEVSIDEIREGGARAAELQSVYLVVRDVVATRATTGVDFGVATGSGANELVVTSYMANDLGPSPFPATANSRYSAIRGFGYRSGPSDTATVAKLAPLSTDDLELAAAAP